MAIEFGEDRNPPIRGSYVAWVNGELPMKFASKILLFWEGRAWGYPLSDQPYRDVVYAWAGPLPAVELEG